MDNDLISRKEAIERATKEHDFFRGAVTVSDKARRDELLNVMCWLGELPPAQPKQLEQCPIYGGMCAYPSDQCYDCPRHAGAKMEVTT